MQLIDIRGGEEMGMVVPMVLLAEVNVHRCYSNYATAVFDKIHIGDGSDAPNIKMHFDNCKRVRC